MIEKRPRLAHRLSIKVLNGEPPVGIVDHICHEPSCVNPEHLCAVTPKQNAENRRSAQMNGKSGICGVSWNKRDRKWQACAKHKGKTQHRGSFDTAEEAEVAVIALRKRLFTQSQN